MLMKAAAAQGKKASSPSHRKPGGIDLSHATSKQAAARLRGIFGGRDVEVVTRKD